METFVVEKKIELSTTTDPVMVLVCDHKGTGILVPKKIADRCLLGEKINQLPWVAIPREFALGIING